MQQDLTLPIHDTLCSLETELQDSSTDFKISHHDFIDALDSAGMRQKIQAHRQTVTISPTRPTANPGSDSDSSLHLLSRTLSKSSKQRGTFNRNAVERQAKDRQFNDPLPIYIQAIQ